jgi:hypothetical protein
MGVDYEEKSSMIAHINETAVKQLMGQWLITFELNTPEVLIPVGK